MRACPAASVKGEKRKGKKSGAVEERGGGDPPSEACVRADEGVGGGGADRQAWKARGEASQGEIPPGSPRGPHHSRPRRPEAGAVAVGPADPAPGSAWLAHAAGEGVLLDPRASDPPLRSRRIPSFPPRIYFLRCCARPRLLPPPPFPPHLCGCVYILRLPPQPDSSSLLLLFVPFVPFVRSLLTTRRRARSFLVDPTAVQSIPAAARARQQGHPLGRLPACCCFVPLESESRSCSVGGDLKPIASAAAASNSCCWC